MRVFLNRLRTKLGQEPLAVLALLTTIVLATLNSEWFWQLSAGKIEIRAIYKDGFDGRCSLAAFSIDNHSTSMADKIRIRVSNDWLQSAGRAQDQIGTRTTELIPPGQATPLPFRPDLQIPFRLNDSLVEIDTIGPDEYIDFFVQLDAKPEVVAIRSKQSKEAARHRFTPRLFAANNANGKIEVTSVGECLDE